MLAAVMATTKTLFGSIEDEATMPGSLDPHNYVVDAQGNVHPGYSMMKAYSTAIGVPSYAPSEASTLQTRTFLSY
jgi:hypothetical protein